jgi:hypothetical protein
MDHHVRMRRTIGVAAVAVAMALGAGACSGSSGSDTSGAGATTPAKTTDKASYVAQANAICADMNDEAIALSRRYESEADTPQNQAAYLRENASIIASTITELRALPVPAGDESQLEAVYDAADELPTIGDEFAAAIASGDEAEINRLGDLGDQAQDEANSRADAYGLTECGSGGSGSSSPSTASA